MLLKKYFGSIYTKPLTVVVNSRDISLYLFRAILFLGIRPIPKRHAILYILWSSILNFLSTIWQPIAFSLSYFTNVSEISPGELLTSVQVSFNTWTCSAKIITVWLMLHRLEKANEVLDKMDLRCTLKEEQQKIRESVALSNRAILIMTMLYMGYSTSTFLSAVFNGGPPYNTYYPLLDWHASRTQFWIQSFLEYFAVSGACVQELCTDGYAIVYVIILRTHVNLLTERLRRLCTKENQSSDDLYKDLVNCILDHKNLISFYNTIGPLIGLTIFLQFLVTGIEMGVALINILLFADFYTGVAASVFVAAILCETAPLCFLCSLLRDDCIELPDAVFHSNWSHTENRYKKTLAYFIQNLQKPFEFKALNVLHINITSIISILKFAFSVYTLIKQMNIAERLRKS